MGVAYDAGASIVVKVVNDRGRVVERECRFDPYRFAGFAFTDPFPFLFGANDLDQVYEALTVFIYDKQQLANSSTNMRKELGELIRRELALEDIDRIRRISVWKGVDNGDWTETSSASIEFAKYRKWHDVARIRLTNWYLLDSSTRTTSLKLYEPSDGFGADLAEAISSLPAEGEVEAMLEIPIVGIEGAGDALGAIDAFSALLPSLEIAGTLEVIGFDDDGRAASELCTTLWSICGFSGVGYKTVTTSHADNFRWKKVDAFTVATSSSQSSRSSMGLTPSFLASLTETTADTTLPVVLGTSGRRMRKGVELVEGDALLLEANIDGRNTEFPKPDPGYKPATYEPKYVSPFDIKVKTLKGKGQGQLVADDMLLRVLALNVTNAVAFVESVEPLTVRVDLLPDAGALSEKVVCNTAFKFVKRNAKKSSKRFTKLTGYLRKFPERK